MFKPIYLLFSDVPHAHCNAVARLHGKELGPFRVRSVRNLVNALTLLLLMVDSRNLTRSQIDVSNGTIGGQVGIIHSRDYGRLTGTFPL